MTRRLRELRDCDGESEAEPEAADAEPDEDEEKPKKKAKVKAVRKKKEPSAAKPKVKRTRAVKEVKMKAVWVVFDNSSKRLDTFAYNQKPEAEEFLAKKQEEKKGTCFMQLVKEQMDS